MIDEARLEDLPELAHLMAASPLLRRYGTTETSALALLRDALAGGDVVLVAAETPAAPRRGLA